MNKRSLLIFFAVCNIIIAADPPAMAQKKAALNDVETIYASSEHGENTVERIIDGDPETVWESVYGVSSAWLVIELKKERVVGSVRIDWESGAALVYDVLVSLDGENWEHVSGITDGEEFEKRGIKFPPIIAKYLKIK